MKTALRLCPHLVVVPPSFAKYREASRILHSIFDEFSPCVEPLSLDEAFLDLTGAERALGPPNVIGERIRARIRAELRITGSVGISTSKFVAKLASDHHTPDGLTLVPADQVGAFVGALPLERLPGVGPATLDALHRAGIRTMRTGRTVGVKLRTPDFKTATRHRTLERPANDAAEIYRTARELFAAWWDRRTPLRLVGVGIQNLEECAQLDLFAAGPEGAAANGTPASERTSLHGAEDEIVAKYGAKALVRARTFLAHEVESTGSMPGRGPRGDT
jgi:nucleotidyltransferase/DNA polymerase involved in DNA repair